MLFLLPDTGHLFALQSQSSAKHCTTNGYCDGFLHMFFFGVKEFIREALLHSLLGADTDSLRLRYIFFGIGRT